MADIIVFISHKREDSSTATEIYRRISAYAPRAEAYLDVLDPHLAAEPGELVRYVQSQLSRCTHLMAVLSRSTQRSWWVPFEVGMAAERAYPLATYGLDASWIPEFLQKWPYLTSPEEVDTYVTLALATRPTLVRQGLRAAAVADRRGYSTEFHSALRRELRQA